MIVKKMTASAKFMWKDIAGPYEHGLNRTSAILANESGIDLRRQLTCTMCKKHTRDTLSTKVIRHPAMYTRGTNSPLAGHVERGNVTLVFSAVNTTAGMGIS